MLFVLICIYLLFCKWQSDLDHSQNSNNRSSLKNNISSYGPKPLSQRPAAANHRPALRRSLSHKDLKCNDGYSVSNSTPF